jgi:hypothetical protein
MQKRSDEGEYFSEKFFNRGMKSQIPKRLSGGTKRTYKVLAIKKMRAISSGVSSLKMEEKRDLWKNPRVDGLTHKDRLADCQSHLAIGSHTLLSGPKIFDEACQVKR